MKTKILSVTIILAIALTTSCTTIDTQQYTYVGDATREKNVTGKSTHYDYLGLGITSKAYANEYNNAIKDTFKAGGSGTKELKNVKIFKAKKWWPQVIGSILTLTGYTLMAQQSMNANPDYAIPFTLVFAGGGISGLNTYDFVVVAEPVYE